MKALELNILNRLAPYEVELRDGEYYFHTDFDIVYSAEFKYEPSFGGLPTLTVSQFVLRMPPLRGRSCMSPSSLRTATAI